MNAGEFLPLLVYIHFMPLAFEGNVLTASRLLAVRKAGS